MEVERRTSLEMLNGHLSERHSEMAPHIQCCYLDLLNLSLLFPTHHVALASATSSDLLLVVSIGLLLEIDHCYGSIGANFAGHYSSSPGNGDSVGNDDCIVTGLPKHGFRLHSTNEYIANMNPNLTRNRPICRLHAISWGSAKTTNLLPVVYLAVPGLLVI